MPVSVVRTEPEVVIEHQGTRVFRCYLNDDADAPEQYIFTTHVTDTDSLSPRCFDVRMLCTLPSVKAMRTDRPQLVDDTFARKRGMELADYTRTPEYVALRVEWDAWWETKMPELIRQALLEAIEGGMI